jgi:uncharacterized protein
MKDVTTKRMDSPVAVDRTARAIARAWCYCLLGLAMTSSLAQAPADAALAAYEREDYAAAAALYATRASAGDAEAQYRMGMMARFGWGVEKDARTSARWLRLAAEQSHAQAQAELGTMYRLGRGVPEDPMEAARWLTKAATADIPMAQLSIGRMYRDGLGVGRDLVEAYAWFSAAGENSVMDGLAYRNEITREMSPEQIAEGKRRAAERARKQTETR